MFELWISSNVNYFNDKPQVHQLHKIKTIGWLHLHCWSMGEYKLSTKSLPIMIVFGRLLLKTPPNLTPQTSNEQFSMFSTHKWISSNNRHRLNSIKKNTVQLCVWNVWTQRHILTWYVPMINWKKMQMNVISIATCV